MDKFGRNYLLNIQNDALQTLTFGLPFTIEFDITRTTLSSINVCQIRLYNLSDKSRNSLRYNLYNWGLYRPLELRAGYQNDLGILFKGNVQQCWSVREGVNFITQIECYDGGFASTNGKVDAQFPAGTNERVLLNSLITSGLPNVKLGSVGNFSGTLSRSASFTGNTVQVLTEYTGGAFFIDNEKAYALKTDEYRPAPGPIIVINSASGLLGTPTLEQNVARFDMLFEPKLEVGGLVQIQSTTEPNFNGLYKTTAVKHRGMISDAVCGEVVTSGEFFFIKELSPGL